VDASWIAVLHYGHQHNFQFGSDVVFTYGPLGFALTGVFHPSTYGAMIGLQLLCVLSGGIALEKIRREHFASVWLGLIWLIAIPAFAVLLEIPYVLLLLWIALRVAPDHRGCRFIEVLLAAVLGVSSLTKFTCCLAGVGVFFLSAIDDVARRRRAPLSSAAWLGGLVVGWLAAGQRLSGLPGYLTMSLEITRGYTDAMFLPGSIWEQLAYIATLAIIGCHVALISLRREGRWGVVPIAMFAYAAFAIFKAAFVRSDWHENIGSRVIVIAGLLFVPLFWNAVATSATRICLVAALVPGLLGGQTWDFLAASSVQKVEVALRNIGLLLSPVAGYREMVQRHEQRLAQIAARHALPAPRGSVDIYNHEQSIAVANNWKYVPRPVIQSYSAYTEPLLRLNAEHLRGPRAPESIYFNLKEIDARLPMQMDSLSWPELLSRYESEGLFPRGGKMLLLRRRGKPRGVEWGTVEARVGRLGEPLTIPATRGKLIWARLRLRPTIAHRAASLLYKPEAVSITIDEQPPAFRLIPAIAETGFLISPLIFTSSEFNQLFRRESELPYVSTIRIDATKHEYDSAFELELSELRLTAGVSLP
jgi:hypothetical protein